MIGGCVVAQLEDKWGHPLKQVVDISFDIT